MTDTGHSARNQVALKKTITLLTPALVAGHEVTEITLRRPPARTLRLIDEALKAQKSDIEVNFIIVSCCTGLTVDEVENLSLDDFEAISMETEAFFEARASTSPTPSDGEVSSQTAPQS